MTTNADEWAQYYDATDIDAAKSDWETDKKASERTKAHRPHDGEHLYRFLPKRKGAKHPHFYRIVYIHYLRNPRDPDGLLMVGLCPSKMEDKECVLCSSASKLRKKTNMDWKQIRDLGLSPQRKIYAGVVRLKNDGTPLSGDDGKPFVMDLPYSVEEQIMPLLDKASIRFYGDIAHPFTGVNVAIERTGKGREGTEYAATPFQKPIPLADLEWLKDLPDLDNIEAYVGADKARNLLGEYYPETGYLPPVEGSSSGGGGSTSEADEDDEYELVVDPDKPGEMISKKELRERAK